MHPSEAGAALAADPGLGLVLDRRASREFLPLGGAVRCVGRVEVEARHGVAAWLVRAPGGSALPRTISSEAFGAQRRLLDRFYLPDRVDESAVALLFDIVADVYDALHDQSRNFATATLLLGHVLDRAAPDPLVLDLGCGTGVASAALAASGRQARLLGTDLSSGMLRIAEARGERTIPIDEWRADPPTCHGAIACFVLHYGVSDSDLSALVRGLVPGSIFAANWHGRALGRLDQLDVRLRLLGMEPLARIEAGYPAAPGLIVRYLKSEGRS